MILNYSGILKDFFKKQSYMKMYKLSFDVLFPKGSAVTLRAAVLWGVFVSSNQAREILCSCCSVPGAFCPPHGPPFKDCAAP